jgi:hypothetical protein
MNGVRTGKDFQSAMTPFATAGLKETIAVDGTCTSGLSPVNAIHHITTSR